MPALGADGEHGDRRKHGERRNEQNDDAGAKGRDHLLALGRLERAPAHRALRQRDLREEEHQAKKDDRVPGRATSATVGHRFQNQFHDINRYCRNMSWMRTASGTMRT